MIKAFTLLLLSLVAGWFVADAIKHNGPGYVLIYYQHYSVETSVWIALLLVFLLVLISYLIVRLLAKALQLSSLTLSWRKNQQQQRFSQTVQALLANDWQRAYQLAQKSQDEQAPLVAAQAAFLAGDSGTARTWLKSAASGAKVDKLALMLLHYDIELKEKNQQEALQLLDQLLAQEPSNSAVLSRAVDGYCQFKQMDKLQSLLTALLKKSKGLHQSVQHQSLLKAGRALIKSAQQQNNPQSLADVWLLLGKSSVRNALLADYCRALLLFKQGEEAKKLITARLKHQFDESCLLCYALLDMEKEQQLVYLEQMDKQYPFNAQVQLALGVVLLRAQNWQKALQAIEHSITYQPSADAYRFLSLYYEKRGDQQHAKQSLIQAIDL